VILVDFRGFDTYGEITVLAIAALGIFALLAGITRSTREAAADPGAAFHPLMLALLARVLLPLALLVSVHILLRGHNLPGGGFIAGLFTSVAIAMLYVANGAAWTTSRMQLDFHRVIAAGLAIAGATGLGAGFFDSPFLTSTHGHVHVPVVGDLHLATAALFDLGVYLVVVGVVVLILEQMGRLTPGRAATG
jgi:multicomponent K+:H+ antiporter subunit A